MKWRMTRRTKSSTTNGWTVWLAVSREWASQIKLINLKVLWLSFSQLRTCIQSHLKNSFFSKICWLKSTKRVNFSPQSTCQKNFSTKEKFRCISWNFMSILCISSIKSLTLKFTKKDCHCFWIFTMQKITKLRIFIIFLQQFYKNSIKTKRKKIT